MDMPQDDVDRILKTYFLTFPLGGPRIGTDPITDALMLALREANMCRQNAISEIEKHAYHQKCAEDISAFEGSRISALLDELSGRLAFIGK